jgi:argininosuccinate lyase
MPIQLSHWWLSHFWPLQRDRQRLNNLLKRTLTLPLGSAALAGTTLDIDRENLKDKLGFLQVSPNSLDAVSDRDFVAEFLFCSSLTGIHLSKLAEAVILFTTQEFDFFELGDAFTTGSSIMPQKKNPDIFELARGKSGSLLGRLTGFLATLKALPSTYDKDLQEDKPPVFFAVDTLNAMLPLFGQAIQGIKVKPENMEKAISPAMLATHLADRLVKQGVPFREAHGLVGKAVHLAEERGQQISDLSKDDFIKISPVFDFDIHEVLDARTAIEQHKARGGTSTSAVLEQISLAKAEMKKRKYSLGYPRE